MVEVGKKKDENVYKYALGNENVIDAHIYQIKSKLPSEFGGIVWLGLAQSRNTPYVPFYGNVEDTYDAFKPRTDKYDGKSWYWSVWHIDQMVMKYPEIFGTSIQEKWKTMEDQWVKDQAERDAKYEAYTAEQAKAAGPEVTKEALERSEKIFKEIKSVEKEMEEKIKEKKAKMLIWFTLVIIKQICWQNMKKIKKMLEQQNQNRRRRIPINLVSC